MHLDGFLAGSRLRLGVACFGDEGQEGPHSGHQVGAHARHARLGLPAVFGIRCLFWRPFCCLGGCRQWNILVSFTTLLQGCGVLSVWCSQTGKTARKQGAHARELSSF